MNSIKTKITAITVCGIAIAMVVAAVLGVTAIRNLGNRSANQTIFLLCEKGQKDLNHYFDSVEQSVGMVSAYVESDLSGLGDDELQSHLNRVSDIFRKLTYKTDGVLTYYYRIDPAISKNVKGFWFVNLGGEEFEEHEATDISLYDTEDTSQLVWFTVPKATGEGVWLPPYITDNLDVRVISYNIPVYYESRFVGVIGIEIDYSTMAEEVNNITLYENGYAFLNDAEGKLVYHPNMDVTVMKKQPAVPKGIVVDNHYVQYKFDGIEKKAVWLPLNNGMRLNVTVPVQEINAYWHNWGVEIVVFFAVILGVFIFFIMAFVGRITRPLQNLTKAAEQISKGYYDCELTYDKNDEVGILTNTFKKVIDSLNTTIRNLNDMAYVDALTGVRNRMALSCCYESYKGHEVTVMMLDLDDFKIINDTKGHDEGDRIIKATGRLLADTFGEKNCYRYGGDEFLVVMPDISEAEFNNKLESMLEEKKANGDMTNADFSIGTVHSMLDDPDMMRTLISGADEKMYEVKRDKKRSKALSRELCRPQIKATEYTVEELKAFVDELSEKYAVARVVDPMECRIIELKDNGKISMDESCYSIWNADKKCINCSSALACRTGCAQEKAEHFKDNYYFVQSNPVKLKLPNGSIYDAVVELVNVEGESLEAVNNRESENIGTRAAYYFARHDSLTNVLNADGFYELAREHIKSGSGKVWMMITGDIMNFRLINTLFGVQRGNEILVRTALMLKGISDNAGGLCGRIGGDQFALLIPKSKFKERDLTNVSQRLAEIYNSGISKFYIHFGVYKITDLAIPVSVMCGRANSALHTIRDDMTQIVAYFSDSILENVFFEQMVLGSFDEALKTGQFKIYLQPLVNADGDVTGAEALARWQKPDGTILMPKDFIETLETAGMIYKLDRYIWELAVKQLSKWKNTKNKHITISVNVSAKDFYSFDVADVFTRLVAKYGVDSRMLRLEITETALLGRTDQCKAIVAELRNKGFLVEIDDFGKDNSSLSLIKEIQADILKIDMSLVREICETERSRIILKSLISMANSLGMEVVTEGVETENQLRALLDMGCNYFQGFYFSKPISVSEFEARYNFEK